MCLPQYLACSCFSFFSLVLTFLTSCQETHVSFHVDLCLQTPPVSFDAAADSVYVCVHVHSVVSDSYLTPQNVARQASLSIEFSRQGYWSGLPFPTPGDLPDPGIQPASLMYPALTGVFFTTESPGKPAEIPIIPI